MLCAAAVLAAAPLARAADAELAAMLDRFCEIQTTGDPARLRALMTADLAAVIDEAQARNDAVATAAGPGAAPLAGGIPYRSMAEPPASCVPSAIAASSNVTIVDIAYAVDKGERWTDRLVLKPGADGMRIDDILFASFLTDTYNAGLRRVLADSFDQ